MSKPKFNRLGIWNGEVWNTDHFDIHDEIRIAQYAEEHGFDSVWQAESRLVRDCISMLGAYTEATDTIELCTGVTNNWTRNVALMAVTWSTLDELSGGRMKIGIGSWVDSLATRVGIDRKQPLRAMWEYCTVLHRLLSGESVTYDGNVLQLEDVKLTQFGSNLRSHDVPIYIGATGPKMNEMAGELVGMGILEGVFMNYMVPPGHNERCLRYLKKGVESQGESLGDIDRPQLIAVSMSEDRTQAIDRARWLTARYIATQPHIQEASNVDGEVIEKIQQIVGASPTREDIEDASALVPDDVVTNIVAAGTPKECVERVYEYCEKGCTEPVLYPLGNTKRAIEIFSDFKTAPRHSS